MLHRFLLSIINGNVAKVCSKMNANCYICNFNQLNSEIYFFFPLYSSLLNFQEKRTSTNNKKIPQCTHRTAKQIVISSDHNTELHRNTQMHQCTQHLNCAKNVTISEI